MKEKKDNLCRSNEDQRVKENEIFTAKWARKYQTRNASYLLWLCRHVYNLLQVAGNFDEK